MSKFDFLNKKWPDLALLAKQAEDSFVKNPNECMQKTGYFIEKLINEKLIIEKLANKNNRLSFFDRMKLLEINDLLSQDIANDINMIRVARNQAVHSEYNSHIMAETALTTSLKIAKWFMQIYGDWSFELDDEKESIDTNHIEKNEIKTNKYISNKFDHYDFDLYDLWGNILSCLSNNKTEFHTIPKGNRQPVR